jgi:hypothetical protein
VSPKDTAACFGRGVFRRTVGAVPLASAGAVRRLGLRPSRSALFRGCAKLAPGQSQPRPGDRSAPPRIRRALQERLNRMRSGNTDDVRSGAASRTVSHSDPVWTSCAECRLRRRLARKRRSNEAARGSKTARRGGVHRAGAPRGCAAVGCACDWVFRHGIA